jgi:hypothetical protein
LRRCWGVVNNVKNLQCFSDYTPSASTLLNLEGLGGSYERILKVVPCGYEVLADVAITLCAWCNDLPFVTSPHKEACVFIKPCN